MSNKSDKIDFNNFDSISRCKEFIKHYSSVEINRVNTRLFWRDLSKFWMTFDDIDHDAIAKLMFDIPWRAAFLTKECQSDLRCFSDHEVFTLYRGQNDDDACGENKRATGLSWYTNIKTAEKFAKDGAGTPYILKTEVPKYEIAMAFNQSDEVVLFELDINDIEVIYLNEEE